MLQSGRLAGLARHTSAAAAANGGGTGGGGARTRATSAVVAWGRGREREEASLNHPLSGDRHARKLSSSAVTMESAPMPSITLDNMNPAIKKMEYAVRGPLVIRATALEKELEKVKRAEQFNET